MRKDPFFFYDDDQMSKIITFLEDDFIHNNAMVNRRAKSLSSIKHDFIVTLHFLVNYSTFSYMANQFGRGNGRVYESVVKNDIIIIQISYLIIL